MPISAEAEEYTCTMSARIIQFHNNKNSFS